MQKTQIAMSFKIPETKLAEVLNEQISQGYYISFINVIPKGKLAGQPYVYVTLLCEK